MKAFLKRKNIEISLKRYGIDALGAMAQGLFCSLLIGTIIDTLGKQLNIGFLTQTVATVYNAAGRRVRGFKGIGTELRLPMETADRWQNAWPTDNPFEQNAIREN